MARTIAQVELDTLVTYLEANWLRSSPALQGIVVEDPGHGIDEISPIALVGRPFNPETTDDVSPFSPFEVKGGQLPASGPYQKGTGFLLVGNPVDVGDAELRTPGPSPEMRQETSLDFTILTPSGAGPDLSNVYAGVLAQLFRYLHLTPTEPVFQFLKNRIPPAETASENGDDGTWRHDDWSVSMWRYYRALRALAA